MSQHEENIAIITIILMAAFGTKNVHSALSLGSIISKSKLFLKIFVIHISKQMYIIANFFYFVIVLAFYTTATSNIKCIYMKYS